jgi:methyl-accepting chemotaxis protein
MNNIENLKNDIVFINEFATDLFGKTSKLSGKTIESINKMNQLIEIEKNNEKFLEGVSESISDEEIKKTVESLEKYIKEISEKQSEYIELINKNSKNIARISDEIRNKKEMIDNIYNLCNKLEEKTSLVINK